MKLLLAMFNEIKQRRSIHDSVTEAVNECNRIEKEANDLLEQRAIDQDEANHRIGNAAQVLLFAQDTAARLKKVVHSVDSAARAMCFIELQDQDRTAIIATAEQHFANKLVGVQRGRSKD